MSHVAKQIYRKINTLFPDLQDMEPFTKVDLKKKGDADIQLLMLDRTPGEINFILTRFEHNHGQLIANPSIEIAFKPNEKTANVKTYKDPHYFHTALPEPDDIGEIALSHANMFLYEWLNNLKHWQRNQSSTKIKHFER